MTTFIRGSNQYH